MVSSAFNLMNSYTDIVDRSKVEHRKFVLIDENLSQMSYQILSFPVNIKYKKSKFPEHE